MLHFYPKFLDNRKRGLTRGRTPPFRYPSLDAILEGRCTSFSRASHFGGQKSPSVHIRIIINLSKSVIVQRCREKGRRDESVLLHHWMSPMTITSTVIANARKARLFQLKGLKFVVLSFSPAVLSRNIVRNAIGGCDGSQGMHN